MNCPEVQELLSDYHDGALAENVQSRVAEHLVECVQCAQEVARFEKLSAMAPSLTTPAPPERMWLELGKLLDDEPKTRLAANQRQRSTPIFSMLSIAAMILVTVGVGWFGYATWFSDSDDDQFTAEFGRYLEEFRHDPNAAQQILLTNYESERVDAKQAMQRVGYRPAIFGGLPAGYTVESTRVMKMPCCTCVQTVCKRSDGSTLAIFEHDDGEPQWFGKRPEITASCQGTKCCLVELDDRIAASWKRGKRHITLIGVQDIAEVDRMIAWLDEKKRGMPK